MLIRVSTSFFLSRDLAGLQMNPITDFAVGQLCASPNSAFFPPKVRRTHSNSMSSLVRAEMHSRPDRPSLKSLPRSSRPPKPVDTQLPHYNSRTTLSSPSRRERTSPPHTLSLPPSPKVTASANKETPLTPSKVRNYSLLTPSASVSSFGTGSFAFPAPRTPPKSNRSVPFLVIHIWQIYTGP